MHKLKRMKVKINLGASYINWPVYISIISQSILYLPNHKVHKFLPQGQH